MSVRQQFTRQGNGLGFGAPKSRKSIRSIDVDDETIVLLREQHERQRFDRRAWGNAYRADLDLVFCRPGGSPEDPNVIGRRFTRRVRELATLQTLGFPRRAIALSLVQEGMLLAAAGSLAAAALALATVNGVAIRFTMAAFPLRIDGPAVVIGCGAGLLLGVVGAIPPAVRAMRLQIVEGLKAV